MVQRIGYSTVTNWIYEMNMITVYLFKDKEKGYEIILATWVDDVMSRGKL